MVHRPHLGDLDPPTPQRRGDDLCQGSGVGRSGLAFSMQLTITAFTEPGCTRKPQCGIRRSRVGGRCGEDRLHAVQRGERAAGPPAIVAHAAATAAALLPGRFSLGLGSGENLNEHILGDGWPPVADRQARLEEAIEVIRLLWKGGLRSHRGEHYTVENARIYSLPEELPPILVAVAGQKSVDLAARAGDPERHVAAIQEYVDAGYDHVYVHQIGSDQEGFSFYEREVLPHLSAMPEPA